MSTTKKGSVREEVYRTGGILVGAFIYAVGVNLFMSPAGLYTGGVMGISQVIRTVLNTYLHVDTGSFDIAGLIYYLFNIPIFLLAFSRIGRKFFTKTLITVTAMTVFLSLIPSHAIVSDRMTACVVGGIIAGAGTGIVLRMGSSSGGTDVIGIILARRNASVSVGRIGLFVNLALYAVCLILFDVEIVVYSIIYAAVYSMAVDRLHIQNINAEVHVITKIQSDEMEQEILHELNRGITRWQAIGSYTHQDNHVLYITMSKYEVAQFRQIIHKYDPHAFVVVNEGVHIMGNYEKRLEE